MLFKTKLDSLSPANQALLAYYGDWAQDPAERRKLAITGTDEYHAIRQSLYVMFVILEHDKPEDILEILAKPYSEEYAQSVFQYPGIVVTPANEKAFLDNVNTLLKMRNTLRSQFGEGADSQLTGLFLHHDLGKTIGFLYENQLVDLAAASASSHELYLQAYLSKPANAQLKDAFKSAEKWTDIFDGLGYNAASLAASGYTGYLTIVEKSLSNLQSLNGKNPDTTGNEIEALNAFLFDKVRAISLDLEEFNFLIAEATKRTHWLELPFENQRKIAMVLLCCPFIFIKPTAFDPKLNGPQVTAEFITLWNSGKHNAVINKMTQFLIENKTNPSPVWLYNITGLIHHPKEQNGGHFANGGTVEQLFTVLFPFIMQTLKDTTPEPAAARKFNNWQILQGVEITADMLSCLLNGREPHLAAINLASPAIKQRYFTQLEHAPGAPLSPLVANSLLKPPATASTAATGEVMAMRSPL